MYRHQKPIASIVVVVVVIVGGGGGVGGVVGVGLKYIEIEK